LKQLNNELYHPFPHDNVWEIQNKFNEKLQEDDILTADLDSYWANIAGSLSYILKGKIKRIPVNQINDLKLTFFEAFPQYSFLEREFSKYTTLHQEYKTYEKVRKLMLKYVFDKA